MPDLPRLATITSHTTAGGQKHTWAVGAPGALIGVGGSRDVDIEVIRQQTLKHAARFACLHIEH